MTSSADQPLAGTELVLLAQVPRGKNRWQQTHFNLDVASTFFRLTPGSEKQITLERVDAVGELHEAVSRKLVLSDVNRNAKIEFGFGDVKEYPSDGRPLLLVLELDLRTFRYQALMPRDVGYNEMLELNRSLPPVGRGLPRGLTTLEEVEAHWPGCKIRSPTRSQPSL